MLENGLLFMTHIDVSIILPFYIPSRKGGEGWKWNDCWVGTFSKAIFTFLPFCTSTKKWATFCLIYRHVCYPPVIYNLEWNEKPSRSKVWTVDKTFINSLLLCFTLGLFFSKSMQFVSQCCFRCYNCLFFINVISSFPMKMMYLTEILCIILDTKM